jgi:hypothetical protein
VNLKGLISDAALDRAEALVEGVLQAYLETGVIPEGELDLEAVRNDVVALFDKHRDLLATGSVSFAFDVVRSLTLAAPPGADALDSLDLGSFTNAELAAFATAGAERAGALRARTIDRRAELVADLQALGAQVARGALSAALVALLAV